MLLHHGHILPSLLPRAGFPLSSFVPGVRADQPRTQGTYCGQQKLLAAWLFHETAYLVGTGLSRDVIKGWLCHKGFTRKPTSPTLFCIMPEKIWTGYSWGCLQAPQPLRFHLQLKDSRITLGNGNERDRGHARGNQSTSSKTQKVA